MSKDRCSAEVSAIFPLDRHLKVLKQLLCFLAETMLRVFLSLHQIVELAQLSLVDGYVSGVHIVAHFVEIFTRVGRIVPSVVIDIIIL